LDMSLTSKITSSDIRLKGVDRSGEDLTLRRNLPSGEKKRGQDNRGKTSSEKKKGKKIRKGNFNNGKKLVKRLEGKLGNRFKSKTRSREHAEGGDKKAGKE